MYHQISDNFSNEELRFASEKYGVQYDNLAGETKQAKALSLFQHAQRHRRIADLARACAEINPELDWSPWGGPGPILSLHQALREMLTTAFNDSEIETLAFDLNYDDLPRGVGKTSKIDSLVSWAIQRNKIEQILLFTQNRNPVRYRQWYYPVQDARKRHIEHTEPLVSKAPRRTMPCPHCGGTGTVKAEG